MFHRSSRIVPTEPKPNPRSLSIAIPRFAADDAASVPHSFAVNLSLRLWTLVFNLFVAAQAFCAVSTAVFGAPACGPLRVHPTSPRYFTDGTTNADGALKAIYLAGHEIFVDLQDKAFNKEWTKDMRRPNDPAAKARLLDWDRYLDWVEKLEFNYLRGWIIWSTGSGTAAPPHRVAAPMPFLRTGPGNANDGKPKFDLDRFDESFFQLLRTRARALQERGVYLSVMLFELYGFLDGEEVNGQRLWDGNPFNASNNINGIDVDRNHNRLGEEFFSLEDVELVKLQKAYVEKMVDTLNDVDNLLWEICNEAPAAAFEWQCEMVKHLKSYEVRKPRQHLVLLSPDGWKLGGWSTTSEEKVIESPADWIATAGGWCDRDNPKVYQIKKPVIMDLDHVAPENHDPALVWKAFTRGYHYSLYDHPFEQPQHESPAWQAVRANIHQTRLLSRRVRDLARMEPRPDLASTGFCLANEGQDYIVYVPRQEEIRIQGLEPGRTYRCEWFDCTRPSIEQAAPTTSEAPTLTLRPPCVGAVLFMKLEQ
jgi:hypothetical protein